MSVDVCDGGPSALLLACATPAALDATTLAIIRTRGEIVFAADSLITVYGTRPQQACKIRRHGDVVFATAGLVESSEGMLDTHRIITQVLQRNVTWTEHVRTIEQRLQEPLLRTLRRMRRELPDQFLQQVEGGFALHVSLATFRHGVPLLEMREFFVELSGRDAMRLRVRRWVGGTPLLTRHPSLSETWSEQPGGLSRGCRREVAVV